MKNNPPSDLEVKVSDRQVAYYLVGNAQDAELNRSAQYIRQHVNEETEELTAEVNRLRDALQAIVDLDNNGQAADDIATAALLPQ